MGWTNCGPATVCAFVSVPDSAAAGLWKLTKAAVPEPARWEHVDGRLTTPELSSFGVDALEIVPCEQCGSRKLTTQNNGWLTCDGCGHEQREIQ